MTIKSRTWSADIKNTIIGLKTQNVKNSVTGELELNAITILVNLCNQPDSSPVLDEYLASRYYGNFKPSTIKTLRSKREFEHFSARNYTSRWPETRFENYIIAPGSLEKDEDKPKEEEKPEENNE